MTNLVFTTHALARMALYQISKETVSNIVNFPDEIIDNEDGTSIYQSLFEKEKSKKYLIRVVVAQQEVLKIVITVYPTSRTSKYTKK